MRTILIVMVIAYVTLTLGGASAALAFTIRIYTLHGMPFPATFSAAILNTAAVFAATSFFGVLDMFLTLWTLLKSKDWEEEARKEREADRQAREADRQAREKEREENRQAHEADRQAREKEREENRQAREADRQTREADRQTREADRQAWQQSLQENRAFQQQILDQLAAERAAQAQITSRALDLLEQVTHRLNGNGNGARPTPDDPSAE